MVLKIKNMFQKRSSPKEQKRQHLIQEERKHLLSQSSDFFAREAYKTLRTNVNFALVGKEDAKVILVTSSMQGEGKSISAANLAISYAMTDKKVIILDCDLRRPKLGRLLEAGSKTGLSNLLVNYSLKSQAICKSKIKNLDVIPAGDIPPNPSELLCGERMQQLLDELRQEYDYIVLDTPPVNMVVDAVVLAPLSDGVLMVVRAFQSERGAVIQAVEQLSYAKVKILGFVLNGIFMGSVPYRYAAYRRYGYRRYGYSSPRAPYAQKDGKS